MTDNRYIVDENQKNELTFWRSVFRLNTCIPAIIDDFNPATQRVSATPAIRTKYVSPDGTVSWIDYPKITNIPLATIKSKGLKITYPIEIGQNCTLIFSQRSIDNFLIEGGIQNPYDSEKPLLSQIRCMDLTDALCFPGVITDKEPIEGYAQDAIEIRSADGDTKLSVKEKSLKLSQGNAMIELNGGNISMNATTITINGTAVNIGQVTTIDTKPFLGHQHSGVTSGNQTSGGVA